MPPKNERAVVAMMIEADVAGSVLLRPAQSLKEVGTDWFGNTTTDPKFDEEDDDPFLTGLQITLEIMQKKTP